MKQLLLIPVLAVFLSLSTGPAFSAEREKIYGSQLMTQQERLEHQEKIRSMKTVEERERDLKEHHEKMDKRAKAQGMMLPHDSPAMGDNMGRGGDMGGNSHMGGGGR